LGEAGPFLCAEICALGFPLEAAEVVFGYDLVLAVDGVLGHEAEDEGLAV
jgi:hypothetical protein